MSCASSSSSAPTSRRRRPASSRPSAATASCRRRPRPISPPSSTSSSRPSPKGFGRPAMASLKDLRLRIRSVKSTQKITAAMKMVAAAKLRRAQDAAVAARPYAERLQRLLAGLASPVATGAPPPLGGTGKEDNHLVIVAAADRGLCGSFNTSIIRDSRHLISGLLRQGKNVRIFCIGRKAREQLAREYGKLIVGAVELAGKKRIGFADADAIAQEVLAMFQAGSVDVA